MVDEAGNPASATESPINIDLTDPLISPSRSVAPNANGWNKTGVTVSYIASDALSGIDLGASDTGDDVLSTEGAGQSGTGTVVDEAGNSASATESPINIDLTDPLISPSRSVAPNANVWNKTGVTVSYIASDALSGIDLGASDIGDDVLSTEGAGQSGTGTVVDEAGNSASATESPINIDLTDPLISSSRSVAPNANGWNKTGVTVSYIASDALSGIDLGASDTGDDVLSTEGAGQSGTGTVVDEAGNSALATESPINIDLTDPVVTPPADQTIITNDPAGAIVSFSPTATDTPSGLASLVSSPAIGSLFPVGVTTVTHTATDKADNRGSATHNVTVLLVADVDVKPGSDVNPLNLNCNGVVPIAILGSATFDVAAIDVGTVSVGPDGASPVHGGHIEDVNDDGFDDLVVHVREWELGIDIATPGGTVLTLGLTGQLANGTPFSGEDQVRINKNNSSSKGKGGKGPK